MSNGNQVMSPVYDRMLNMRNTYSSVLQGYRSIFATIQSLLVGAGTVFSQFPGNRLPLFALLLSSVGLTVVWYIVCQRRGYDERYFHWQLMRTEKGGVPPTNMIEELDRWRADDFTRKVDRLVADNLTWPDTFDRAAREAWLKGTTPRGARWWLDKFLPSLFLAAWAILFGFVFLTK